MIDVSIIVPIYRVEKYLDKALDSVLKQDLENIEIICVNDGSDDGCSTILEKYRTIDDRIQVFTNDNHGYGYTVNYGISKASGKYIGIFEPDDLLTKNGLKKLFTLAEQYDLDMAKGDYYQMIGNKDHVELIPARLHQDEDLYNEVFNCFEKPKALCSQIINCSGIFKNELIKKNNIKLCETPGASFQDIGLFFQLFIYSKRVLFTHDYTYCYRNDNPNASTKDKYKLYMAENEYIKTQELIVDVCDDKNLLSSSWSARWRGALGTFSRIDSSLCEEFYNYLYPLVYEAYNNDLLQRSYCNAYQWGMLLKFINNKSDFVDLIKKEASKSNKLERLWFRIKYDGFFSTVCFIIDKLSRKSIAIREMGL